MSRWRQARRGIAGRLLAAMALVIITAALTAWLVASATGPVLFHQHMLEAERSAGTVVEHAEEAFVSASALTLLVALLAAALTALLASVVLARRLAATLGHMSTVAAQVAAGRYEARVPAPHIGAEFDALATSFNEMAARLENVETLRRRLMSDVAHELRTPVATISAYLDGLEDGIEQLTPQTVDVLRAQASRLTRLASDLAAVTQAETGEQQMRREPVSPRELLQDTAAAFADRFAQAGVRLDVDVPRGLEPVLVDQDRFGQVLTNLLDNALRHTPAGGRVTLSAARTPTGTRFAVTDTGEGISAEHLPFVFERFYRVDTARDRGHGGTGIGLAIARGLVHAHGGSITAQSAGAGTGTQFVIELPRAPVRRSSVMLHRPRYQP
ncbi:sensor histidine kinase [Cellulomonas sp. 179-A 9B4 NHS]|uniref:sensor histidine kinase n=1 Tax=Cellulomonas sp. 179-A 9B4 NHS TaxID=3142379 RepID=UPI0039A34279